MVNIKLLWEAFGKFMDQIYGTNLYEDDEDNDDLPVFYRCERII